MHRTASLKQIFCQYEPQAHSDEACVSMISYDESRKKIAEIKAMCSQVIKDTLGGDALAQGAGSLLEPLSKCQRVEIEALVFYAVKRTGLALEAIQREITETLALSAHDLTTVLEYKRVRNYLWARLSP